MSKPILSIIIPVYNTEKYLNKCLNSILNQNLDKVEVICVNDGSTDNSLNILNECSKINPSIKIISKKNGGLSSARNVGIDYAQGEYITFIDSDDFIEPNTYRKVLPYFKISEVDLVYFSTRLVIESGVSRIQDEKYFEHKYSGLVKLTHDVITKMDVCVWNKIYKLSLIKKYNIRFPEGLWYEDNPFFWSYALICDSTYFVNTKFYNYLIRTKSIMSQYNKKCRTFHELDSLLCFEYLLCFVFKWNLIEKFKPILIDQLMQKLYESLYRLPKKERIYALNKATEIVNSFNLTFYIPNNKYLISIANKKYHNIPKINQFFLSKRLRLLGIWNADKYYIICFLGIKIKIKKRFS